jgi:hypothetical protein
LNTQKTLDLELWDPNFHSVSPSSIWSFSYLHPGTTRDQTIRGLMALGTLPTVTVFGILLDVNNLRRHPRSQYWRFTIRDCRKAVVFLNKIPAKTCRLLCWMSCKLDCVSLILFALGFLTILSILESICGSIEFSYCYPYYKVLIPRVNWLP